ncbi:glycosyltransferase [Thermosynechococcus sp. HN-54]|uniref:glycosyltransferase family 2 protein n=1 Tax=Thermosynechococcus sp. HN-54 TaxID=2933959 RepID=UPI00202CEC65|nr:glycosyltransferase family 2 protein [Thermosynechococcus sp. HN-54]URR34626.1 glycosyltransferase [Thermosynechococcus sp. HN-54]
MKLPKISIVTPSFNQGRFLEATIQSVVNQNYPNLEYIIIDGGSTDESVEIIKKYENCLHYAVSERDLGHGNALNKGFAKATGEIMAWINSDDMYLPWCFYVVSQVFERHPEVEWIVGWHTHYNVEGKVIKTRKVYKNIYDFLLGNYAWIQQESVFWRRSLWEKTGGFIDESYEFMVDGELWSRFFLHTNIYHVDCMLGGYRLHDSNRAKIFNQQCHSEMKKIISKLSCSYKCTHEVNNQLSQARKIIRFKKLVFNKYYHKVSLLPLYRKFKGDHYLSELDYLTIAFENGDWKINRFPFSI